MAIMYLRTNTGELIPVPSIKGEKGEPGEKGDPGEQGVQGIQGERGADGYTPVKGVDYYTEADKAEIVRLVIESLGGNPVFGYVDASNNIVVSGNLPDGVYSVKYELEDGSTVNIGELVLDNNAYYSVTNNLTNCVSDNSAEQAIEGESYSATISANDGYALSSLVVEMGGVDISATAVSGGTIFIDAVTGEILITAVAEEAESAPTYTNLATTFREGYRYSGSASGGLVEQDGACACEDFIPFKVGTVVRVKGLGDLSTYAAMLYMDNKTTLNSYGKMNATATHNGYEYDSANDIVTLTPKNDNNAYARFSGILTGTTADVVITVDEPIL